MKSFLKLVKNELIKIFAQTSYKVLIAILLSIFLIIPIGIKGIYALLDFGVNGLFEIDDEIEMYEGIREYTVESEPDYEYYTAYIDALTLYKENGLGMDSWQYKAMFEQYLMLLISEKAYYLLSNNLTTIDDIGESEFSYYVEFDIDSAQYSATYNRFRTERIEYENLILKAKIGEYYDKYISLAQSSIDLYEGELIALRLEHVNDPLKVNELMLYCYEKQLETFKITKAIYSYLKDNNLDINTWQYNTALLADGLSYQISSYLDGILSEDEFKKDSYSIEEYETYENYCNKIQTDVKEMYETSMALVFSVENNIPTQASQSLSTKTIFESSTMTNLTFIMYFAIVLSALIISNEYTTGTARLLFIRPQKRNKILMSKYFTVLLVIVILNAVNVIMSLLISVLVNGVGDVFAPDLIIISGAVSKQISVFAHIGTLILANFKIILITTITFFIASVFKKGALSIVCGFIFNIIITNVGSIICSIFDASKTKYTILPYLNMEIFSADQVEYHLSGFSMGTLFTPTHIYQYAAARELSLVAGIANYAFWFAIIITLLLLLFRKQEIKN